MDNLSVAERIDYGEEIPTPSPQHDDEHAILLPLEIMSLIKYNVSKGLSTHYSALQHGSKKEYP